MKGYNEITCIISVAPSKDLYFSLMVSQVGLMRGGRLLAEAPPETLLTRYECSSLEQTFLLLSEKQHAHRIQQQQGQSLPSIEFVQPPELVLQPEALTEVTL
jgi:hypothetical protein